MLKKSLTYHQVRNLLWRIVPLLLAFNYFSFRVELFRDEDKADHPTQDHFTHALALVLPTLNWETFDKDNAPKAIKIEPWISLQVLALYAAPPVICKVIPSQFQPVRDKSPPDPLPPIDHH